MASDAFPIDVAQLVALFLESLFYGIYLVSFGMCMYTMLSTSRYRQGRRNVFLVVALLFFIFATLDVALLLRHCLDAFIWYHGPGGAIGEFSDISYWVNVMKTVTYVAQTSIGDGMLIYRCYIVYAGQGWIVAAPLCVLWIAGVVVSVIWSYIEFTFHANALLNIGRLTPFITSTVTITLALNLIATSLIVHKIWSVERHSRGTFAGNDVSSLRRAMHIVIESGLMYSVSVVVFFAVYLASNNAQYGVSDCVVQIIGIAFDLIILRVDQGKALEGFSVSESSRAGTHRSLRFQISRQTATFSSVAGVDHCINVGGIGVGKGSDDAERSRNDAIRLMTLKESASSSSDHKEYPASPV